MSTKPLRIGDWRVDPASGQISKDSETARLEVRTLRLLLCLAERAGEVVSIDDLLNQAWAGVIVSPDSVYQAVASLRRQLGDDTKQPTYIETVPRLSKVPGLRVHAPMSAASLKGKTFTIVDMAKMLKVAYVVDGSVRKSGGRLRVAARLIRGDDEYVVWSQTYERPVDDILMVQDDIAGEVTKALRASIEARPNRAGGA